MTKYAGRDFLLQIGLAVDGAWAATTAYAIGDVVSNGGNVYQATASGTSAGSGGPTGTGGAITDGTVTWAYVSPLVGGFGYRTIGAMLSNSLTINNETVDVTDKGSAPWRELFNAGIRSMSASGEGNFTDDARLAEVLGLSLSGALQQFRLISGHGDQFAGQWQVTSFERSGEHNAQETVSFSLESSGAITHTAAP